MPLFIVRNDIVNMTTDAIVLPANQILEQGSGTSRAIFQAAGEEKLTEACRAIGECELGKAVITDGFDLPAKYIIHAVCPKWYGGDMNEKELLRSAYLNSLNLAIRHQLKSISFPLLSTGNYGYPKGEGLEVAISTFELFQENSDIDIYLVLYDDESMIESTNLFIDIESYIDSNYVGAKDESFIIEQGSRRDKWRRAHPFPAGYYGKTFRSRHGEIRPSGNKSDAVRYSISDDGFKGDTSDSFVEKGRGFVVDDTFAGKTIEELIKENKKKDTFSDYLLDLIDQKGMTEVEAYKKANVSKSVFHMIRSNRYHVPKKNTVLAFAIALELDMQETSHLLNKAGYGFSNAIVFDVLMQYFITHKIYNIFEINEILYDYNQPLLGMK